MPELLYQAGFQVMAPALVWIIDTTGADMNHPSRWPPAGGARALPPDPPWPSQVHDELLGGWLSSPQNKR
jgi:hypothetical protein